MSRLLILGALLLSGCVTSGDQCKRQCEGAGLAVKEWWPNALQCYCEKPPRDGGR